MFSPDTNNVAWTTASTERMRILANGNVGIGRTDPANTLDVLGTARITSTLSAGATTVTSLNAGSGAIATTGALSAGSLSAVSGGAISTTGTLSAGATTVTSLAAGSGNITTTGSLSAGSATVTSLAAGSGNITTTGSLSAGAATVTSLGAGSGNITTTGNLVSGSGNAGAPTHTFSGNTTVGMFSPATNSVAWTTASTERVRILANGNVGVGTQAPSVLFDVSGAANITSNLTVGGTARITGLLSAADVSLNTINGSKYSAGGSSGRTFKLNYSGPLTTTVSLFAGSINNVNVDGIDGGPGTGQFYFARSIAVDLSGNAYVEDNGTKIRKVTSSGVIQSSFVTGQSGMNSICIDDAGNLFVGKINQILKVTPAGSVSIFAGQTAAGYGDGTGTSIFFNAIGGIAVDSAGTLYVTESTGNRVRKINSSGVASILAGSTAASAGTSGNTDGVGTLARFTSPSHITVDSAGTVYVVDATHRIRKITSDGTVSTFAGGSSSGSTNGTGTAASFYFIFGIAVDSAGTLYVSDNGNGLIRSITPLGVVSTFSSSIASPYSIFTYRNQSGSIYVVANNNSTVRKIVITRDSTHAGTLLTGTLDTDFNTQLTTSYVTIPAFYNNAKVMSFSLPSTSPSSIMAQWILGLYATVAVPTSPASFYFEIMDGSTSVATGSTSPTSINLSTPLQVYTSSLLVPARAYDALTLNLYVTTQPSSALTIGFNGLNLSYLSTSIQLGATTVTSLNAGSGAITTTGTVSAGSATVTSLAATNFEYIVPSGRLNSFSLQTLGYSTNLNTITLVPLFYSVSTATDSRNYVFYSSGTGTGGYILAPKCRLQLFNYANDSNLLDITNDTTIWKHFFDSNSRVYNADRYYLLYPV
jgi:hypothetical protein